MTTNSNNDFKISQNFEDFKIEDIRNTVSSQQSKDSNNNNNNNNENIKEGPIN